MAVCPFSQKPCGTPCALYTNQGCSLYVIAQQTFGIKQALDRQISTVSAGDSHLGSKLSDIADSIRR